MSQPPRTLRVWYDSSPRSWVWLAERTGLCLRTVMRVAAGNPCSGPTAIALAKVTEVSVSNLLRGRR
jgi:hypothetical protein